MKTADGEILFGEEEKKANSFFDRDEKFGQKKDSSSQHQSDKQVRKSRTFLDMLGDQRFSKNRVRMLHLVACAVYVISPIDLIPDFILGLGVVDDLVVAGYGIHLISEILKDFKTFKKLRD